MFKLSTIVCIVFCSHSGTALPAISFSLKVLVDDVGSLFIDGKELSKTLNYIVTLAFQINPKRHCIGIHVANFGKNVRLMIETSIGIVSDKTWKCTHVQQNNRSWATVEFDDSSWPNAVEILKNKEETYARKDFHLDSKWISVAGHETASQMFCRRRIS